MKTLKIVVGLVILACAGGALFVYSGMFDAGADTPHSRPVYWLAQTVRERSIAVRSKDIQVPNLDDPKLITAGASEYAEMCTGCHLAPGMDDNEMRPGLYPSPPNLSEHRHDRGVSAAQGSAARQFWIIKHGLKMTAMPAWGKTHDDPTIWSMVAFLQKLPELTQEQYAAMTEDSESAHEASGHVHPHGPGTQERSRDHGGMPGMNMPGSVR
ncbi:MAG: cytochrome c [Nevskia sp.]|nr:cytochrome c [Nevskia sp.]